MLDPAPPPLADATAGGVTLPAPPAPDYGGRVAPGASLRRIAARGMVINTVFDVGLGLVGLVRGFVLAGFLSRADYGIWGVLVVSLSALVWLKQAGIGDKFVQQDEPDQEVAFQKAFTLELAFTAICALLILVVAPLLVLIYDLPQLIAPTLVIVLSLLITVFQSPLWIYYRRMDFARQRALSAVDPVVSFVVAVGLAAAGAGYWAFVGAMLAGTSAASLAAVWRSPFRLRIRYERGTLREYWSFSGPLLLAGGASFVIAWSATIATKLDLGVAAVGVIALASTITAFTDRVDALITGALYPAICAVRDRTSLLYESLVKSNRLALMWAVPFGLGVTLFCSDLIHFGLGPRWRPAITLLQIYGVTAAVNHVGFNWTAYLRALNRTRPIAIANLASAGVFLATGIPLLLWQGLTGFALGIGLQALANVAVRAYFLQEIVPGFQFLRHAARSFVPTLPAVGLVLGLRALEPPGRTLALALAELVIYVLVTAALTWYAEFELLREAMGSLRGIRAPATA